MEFLLLVRPAGLKIYWNDRRGEWVVPATTPDAIWLQLQCQERIGIITITRSCADRGGDKSSTMGILFFLLHSDWENLSDEIALQLARIEGLVWALHLLRETVVMWNIIEYTNNKLQMHNQTRLAVSGGEWDELALLGRPYKLCTWISVMIQLITRRVHEYIKYPCSIVALLLSPGVVRTRQRGRMGKWLA